MACSKQAVFMRWLLMPDCASVFLRYSFVELLFFSWSGEGDRNTLRSTAEVEVRHLWNQLFHLPPGY